MVCGVLVVAGCGGSQRMNGVPSTPVPTTSIATAPLTPHDPTRIRPDEQAAVVLLGESGAARPVNGHGHNHHGATIETPLFTGDAATFADQWLVAQNSVEHFDTIEEIEAQGYVRASVPGAGIGTHWVKWSQIAKPFDPAHPAMLLVDERHETPRLVGYSYWVQYPTTPIGFAGPNDVWHQHTGLCVVNGWVDREETESQAQCAGTWLAGGDLWMLHAWVVPGYENRDGKFAQYNPKLCPPDANTPDLMRCPD